MRTSWRTTKYGLLEATLDRRTYREEMWWIMACRLGRYCRLQELERTGFDVPCCTRSPEWATEVVRVCSLCPSPFSPQTGSFLEQRSEGHSQIPNILSISFQAACQVPDGQMGPGRTVSGNKDGTGLILPDPARAHPFPWQPRPIENFRWEKSWCSFILQCKQLRRILLND